mgnify:CR=1 FL=1
MARAGHTARTSYRSNALAIATETVFAGLLAQVEPVRQPGKGMVFLRIKRSAGSTFTQARKLHVHADCRALERTHTTSSPPGDYKDRSLALY